MDKSMSIRSSGLPAAPEPASSSPFVPAAEQRIDENANRPSPTII
jgi:hypothetical protein